jgi:putative RNA 2'-phosphotransferase
MATADLLSLSKFLSFVLRHQPDSIGLTLDPQGWASIDELLINSAAAGTPISRADLMRVVETSEKKRFVLSVDKRRIRAAQGHSIPVDLGLSPQSPPTVLYHGTSTRFLNAILREGIRPLSRQQVHLSIDTEAARRVGQRHGKPIVLLVEALRMHENGFSFFLSENGIWLTDYVPPEYLAPFSSDADSATTSRQPKPSR